MKRNWDKVEREQAEKEKSQLEERERTIADLSRAIEQLVSSNKQPGEGLLAVARGLAAQWKIKKRPLFEGLLENNRLALVTALVAALREDHCLVARIRRHFPDELESLSIRSMFAEVGNLVPGLFGALPKPSPKQEYEAKRRRRTWRSTGLIEWEFGGAREAWAQGEVWLSNPFYSAPLPPTCLDDIFTGGVVNMSRLEELFGIERHRLAKLLDREDKKRGKYGHRVVVKIMNALLKKSPRKKRKRSTPGAPRQMPWLNGANLRSLVRAGMIARLDSLPFPPKIRSAFLKVLHRRLADSGKK
jgi:hypothetical protein